MVAGQEGTQCVDVSDSKECYIFVQDQLDSTSAVLRCGNLPDPPNGRVSTNNPPINGTLANYDCDTGFQLLGAPMRLCQRTQWSGSPPECIRKLYCPYSNTLRDTL